MTFLNLILFLIDYSKYSIFFRCGNYASMSPSGVQNIEY